MNVIKDNNQQPVLRIGDSTGERKMRVVICFSSPIVLMLFTLLASSLMKIDTASGIDVPLKSIAQLTVDDEGHSLNYPGFVFFDPVEEEIYLANGGTNQIVVYGPDYFPRMAIGPGRGVLAPQGGAVMPNGDVYLCQPRTNKNPRRRITILNGAFLVEREIFLDEIPEAANYTPTYLAVNSEGLIYLTGNNNRGVLVLDNDGSFLRRLEPMDMVFLREKIEEKEPEDQEKNEEEDLYSQIPEEFRPRKPGSVSAAEEVLGPAKIINLTIDSKGNLYLISLETGKIYVYGPDENFLFSFGKKGGSPGQLSQPRALAIDEQQGLIYVVDYMRHSILTYDMTGNFLFEFGGRGSAPGWFNFPNGLAINNYGQLIVSDLFNKRVQVLEVGYKEISIYLDASETEPLPETPDTRESTEQEQPGPDQPADTVDQGEESELSLDQMFEIITKEREEEGEINKEETIMEEEVIEVPPPDLPGPPGQFDEPLVTPE